jgi:hypothetical protein
MRNVIFVTFAAMSAAIGSANAENPFDKLPGIDILPEATVQISPVVPGMGEHWANPADLPLGPIYCVYEGKVICLEYMISQEDLAAGKSWPELTGLKNLPPIDHVNMGFEPDGHHGYEIPHYDMHIYFVSPDVLREIN